MEIRDSSGFKTVIKIIIFIIMAIVLLFSLQKILTGVLG
jgi:hypothetical protein